MVHTLNIDNLGDMLFFHDSLSRCVALLQNELFLRMTLCPQHRAHKMPALKISCTYIRRKNLGILID